MEDDLDRLLAEAPLTVPEDFTQRVMARLPLARSNQMQAALAGRAVAGSRWQNWLQWLVVTLSSTAGAIELASFLSCFWAPSVAL
jgi:hypothetical protein